MNKHQRQERLWCFRRWSRKPWAAFASLDRLKIGVLSVAMSIILLATEFAGAQTVGSDTLAQFRTLYLDTLQVTAPSMAAAAQVAVSQTRTIIDRKGITPVQTAESVLRLSPAIDLRERGGKSSQADIAIRGGSFDETMVMLNGIDFSDARTGHQSHSLPIDIDIISDIAVVDHVARPGALAGAVDFRTAPLFPRYLRTRLEGGAWGYGYGNLSGAYGTGGLQVLGAGSYRRSDGHRYNTDFWNANGYVRVLYESAQAGSFDVQGGFQRREWGSNGFYSLRFPDQFESTLTGLASARWARRWRRFSLAATGSFRRNDDRFEMVRGNPDPAGGGIPFNRHTTYSFSGGLGAAYDWRRAGETSLGMDYTHNRMLSSALGNRTRGVVSARAGHGKSWRRVRLDAMGTLVSTPYGTDATFAAEAGWLAGRDLGVTAGVIRSMRLPTFTDLYYNVATYHPDPNLKPEKAMTYRLTAELGRAGGGSGRGARGAANGSWGATASIYYRHTHDVIDWEQRTGDKHGDIAGDWYSTQLNRLGTVGAELTAQYTGENWLRVASLGYGYVHTDKAVATGYISKYALDYMRHKVSAVAGVAFLRGFTLTLTGSFYDRVGSFVAADGSLSGYKPYFLLDGRLAWELGERRAGAGGEGRSQRRAGLQLYLDVTNATGTRYFDFGGLPMPGTWASGGIVITIK